MEIRILAAMIKNRNAYDSVSMYHTENDFSSIGNIIYKEIANYYGADANAAEVDTTVLMARLSRKYTKHADSFKKILESLPNISHENILSDYRSMKLDSYGEIIGGFLLAGKHDKAREIMDMYNSLYISGLGNDAATNSYEIIKDAKTEDFNDMFKSGNRLALAPKEINDLLNGGLLPGSHAVIYGPPESCKTALAITFTFALCFRGKKVLYVGNEEAKSMYLLRLKCRFCCLTEEEIMADPKTADELADSRGWGNLVFMYASHGSMEDVHKEALAHEVDVVVVDQLHNLRINTVGRKIEGTVLLTELAYRQRAFLSKHDIAGISVTQAGDSSIGKLFLSIKDIYNSNIGVQGTADLMLGIGYNDEYAARNRRVLNITKNKIAGKHGYVVVQLDAPKSVVKSVRK
jgi:hypothetical protein